MADPFMQEKEALRLECEKAELEHMKHLCQIDKLADDSYFWSNKWKNVGMALKHSDLPLRLQHEFQYSARQLGRTQLAVVETTTCYGIPIVIKRISTSEKDLETIRDEARHAYNLEGFRHIIRLVGAFSKTYDAYQASFNILYFPIADDNLDVFLNNFESACKGQHRSPTVGYYGAQQISKEVINLYRQLSMEAGRGILPCHSSGNTSVMAVLNECDLQLQQFLREAMGCIAKAIDWMHGKKISHQDLKPANILLRNGQLYLTDFGISRDREGKGPVTETYLGRTRGYCSPQLEAGDPHHLWKDDMYALGCVFMHMITTIHSSLDPSSWGRATCTIYLESPREQREAQIQNYFASFKPPGHQLVKDLLRNDYEQRPDIQRVISDLHNLSTKGSWFYGECCAGNNHPLKPSLPGKYRIFCKGCIFSNPPRKIDGALVEDAICEHCGNLRRGNRLYCNHCDASIKGAMCVLCNIRAICENPGCGLEIPLDKCGRKCRARRFYSRSFGRVL